MVRSPVVVAFAFASLGMGCATTPKPLASGAPGARVAARAAAVDASGVWDWMFSSPDDQGDQRVEQEEWHLLQKGSRLEGYYDRKVTMLSTDERAFRCNQRLGFTKLTRVRVAGRIEGGRIQLREVAFEAKPGPCDDGARNLVEYSGILRGEKLALQWGPQAGQTLTRRSASDGAMAPLLSNAELTGFEPPAPAARGPQPGSADAAIGGTWEWELKSIDAEGDFRLEREEWHLSETPDGVRGYYDRTVKRQRPEGEQFSCNGQREYQTATRYNVVGQRFGETLMLREVDYSAQRSDCDNAQRRLDSYRGHVSDGDSLILSWGPGNQLLHRKK